MVESRLSICTLAQSVGIPCIIYVYHRYVCNHISETSVSTVYTIWNNIIIINNNVYNVYSTVSLHSIVCMAFSICFPQSSRHATKPNSLHQHGQATYGEVVKELGDQHTLLADLARCALSIGLPAARGFASRSSMVQGGLSRQPTTALAREDLVAGCSFSVNRIQSCKFCKKFLVDV